MLILDDLSPSSVHSCRASQPGSQCEEPAESVSAEALWHELRHCQQKLRTCTRDLHIDAENVEIKFALNAGNLKTRPV